MDDITDKQLIRFLDGVGVTLPDHEVLMPGEVAELFRVDPRTVKRWGTEGTLTILPTPGGHSRFALLEVMNLLKKTLSEAIKAADQAGKEVPSP